MNKNEVTEKPPIFEEMVTALLDCNDQSWPVAFCFLLIQKGF